MPKLEQKNIADLPDIMRVSDVMSVLLCSQGYAYKVMDEAGGISKGIRRVFKPNFVAWLKSQGMLEVEKHEVNSPIQVFIGADNSNVCTVGNAYSAGGAGTHQ